MEASAIATVIEYRIERPIFIMEKEMSSLMINGPHGIQLYHISNINIQY